MIKPILLSASLLLLGGANIQAENLTGPLNATDSSEKPNKIGMAAPLWTTLKGANKCISSEKSAEGGHKVICLPLEKRSKCEDDVLKQLKALEGTQKIPECKVARTKAKKKSKNLLGADPKTWSPVKETEK
jgi:hypothetical protein